MLVQHTSYHSTRGVLHLQHVLYLWYTTYLYTCMLWYVLLVVAVHVIAYISIPNTWCVVSGTPYQHVVWYQEHQYEVYVSVHQHVVCTSHAVCPVPVVHHIPLTSIPTVHSTPYTYSVEVLYCG